jgi:hypothetical protein
MPSVTIELTTELAGRMYSFVHTAMIDGGRADRRASRVIAVMRSIIPTGSMEASEAQDLTGDLAISPRSLAQEARDLTSQSIAVRQLAH